MSKKETLSTYKVSFVGRESGAIGVFYTIEETYRAVSASSALQHCINDERYELNHFNGSPRLLTESKVK